MKEKNSLIVKKEELRTKIAALNQVGPSNIVTIVVILSFGYDKLKAKRPFPFDGLKENLQRFFTGINFYNSLISIYIPDNKLSTTNEQYSKYVGELRGLNDYIKKDDHLEGSWQAQRSKEGCGGQMTTHRPAAVTAGCNCSQLLAAYTLR